MNSLDFDHHNLKIDISMIEDETKCENMLNDIKDVLKKYDYNEIARTVDSNDTVKNNYVEFQAA